MPLNTAEYYDPKVGKWTEIARMNQCRFGVGCAVLNDMVYAVGGSDGTNLKTVERYDPDTNTWKMVASMSTARFVLKLINNWSVWVIWWTISRFCMAEVIFFWGKLHHNLERVFYTISNTLNFVETFSTTRCVYIRDETPCLMLFAIISNRPFYSCVWKRDWGWPCFDTNLSALLCKSSYSYANYYFSRTISITKQRRFVSKQGHPQPRFHL